METMIFEPTDLSPKLYEPAPVKIDPTDPPTLESAGYLVGPDSILADSLTADELFRRVRARIKMTRGKFRGALRRSIKAGLLDRAGINLKLTDAGRAILGGLFTEGE